MNNKQLTSLVLVNTVFILILFCLDLIIYTTNNSTINSVNCKDVLLNLSNPNSYINKVTKPFLIELVKNATMNVKRI